MLEGWSFGSRRVLEGGVSEVEGCWRVGVSEEEGCWRVGVSEIEGCWRVGVSEVGDDHLGRRRELPDSSFRNIRGGWEFRE